MNDSDLADEIIGRLNKLIEDPIIREDLGKLIETRVPCSDVTRDHPTIQASEGGVGFLGFLNGLIGTIHGERLNGWGYIAAVFDDNMKLERFRRTDSVPNKTDGSH